MARIGRAHPARAYKLARPVPPVLTSRAPSVLTGRGTLSANASSAGVHNGIAVLAGAGSAGARATQQVKPAAMAGAGHVAGVGGGNAPAHLAGAGTLVPPKVRQRTAPGLTGAGTLSVTAVQRASAPLAGAGVLGPQRAAQRAPAHLTGAGAVAATGSSRVTVHLAGAGTMHAAGATGVAKITRLGSTAQGTAGATTVMTVPKIAGTAQGQLILIWCAAGFAGITWTSSGFTAEPAASGVSGSAQLLWRIADGTEGSAFTVTASAGHSWASIIATYFNENIQSPFDGTPSSGQVNLSSKSVSAASISTTEANDELIWFGFVQASPGNVPQVITSPGGFTPEVTQANSGGTGTSTVGVLMADSLQTGLGATGVISGSVPANAVSGATLIAISTVSTTLTAAGTLTATGGVTLRTALHGAGTLTPKARLSAPSSLAGAGTLSARGVIKGAAALTGAGTFHAGSTLGGVFLRGAGTLRATQSVGGHVPLAGAGVLHATGKVPQVAALHGAGTLSATSKLRFGAAMNGAGTMSARARVSATAHLAGVATMAPSTLGQVLAVLAGAGTMHAVSRGAGAVALAGHGSLTALARIPGHAALHATSSAAVIGGIRGRAVLTGASALTPPRGFISGRTALNARAVIRPAPLPVALKRLTGAATGPTASENAMSSAVNSFITVSQRPLQVFHAYAGTRSTLPPPPPPPPSSSPAVFGASLGPVDSTNAGIQTWINTLGAPMQVRHYFAAGGAIWASYAVSPFSTEAGVRKILIDFEPAKDGSDAAALDKFLASCQTAGLAMDITLYHATPSKGFANPAAFFNTLQFYVPIVTKRGMRHIFDLNSFQDVHDGDMAAWYPGNVVHVDAIGIEYYDTGYDSGQRMDATAAFADSNGVGFGLAEFGLNFSGESGGTATEQQGLNMLLYMYNLMAARIKANKRCYDIVLWSNIDGNGGPGYEIVNQPKSWVKGATLSGVTYPGYLQFSQLMATSHD